MWRDCVHIGTHCFHLQLHAVSAVITRITHRLKLRLREVKPSLKATQQGNGGAGFVNPGILTLGSGCLTTAPPALRASSDLTWATGNVSPRG